MLLHLVQRGGDWAPLRPVLTVSNVTAHPSTASVSVTLWLYNGLLLCSFSVLIKGLTMLTQSHCSLQKSLSVTDSLRNYDQNQTTQFS